VQLLCEQKVKFVWKSSVTDLYGNRLLCDATHQHYFLLSSQLSFPGWADLHEFYDTTHQGKLELGQRNYLGNGSLEHLLHYPIHFVFNNSN
jgi:hypothetical protein